MVLVFSVLSVLAVMAAEPTPLKLGTDCRVGEWRKLEGKFPVGPYLSLVGVPLENGRFFRYNMLIDVPRAFKPADLIDMNRP